MADDTPDDVEDICETKYCKVLGPCNCWISSKLNVLGMFSHRETSSRTGCRVSPLRASLAKTMVVRTAKSNTSIGNPWGFKRFQTNDPIQHIIGKMIYPWLLGMGGPKTTTTSFQPFQLLEDFEAKASVASRRREKRQERAKIRPVASVSFNSLVRVKGWRVVEFSNVFSTWWQSWDPRPDLKFKNRVFFLDLFHRAYIIS